MRGREGTCRRKPNTKRHGVGWWRVMLQWGPKEQQKNIHEENIFILVPSVNKL